MKKEKISFTWEDMLGNNAYVPKYFTKTEAWKSMRSFQGKGFDMSVDVLFDENPHDTGLIDSFIMHIRKFKQDYDSNVGRLPMEWLESWDFDFDEIEPEQLFWMGMFFLQIAEHFGVNKESTTKKENNIYSKLKKEDK